MSAGTQGLRVAVIGGSLGGLNAALFLRDAGCDVDVYERSEVPLEGQGAGIVLNPATVRYFTENDALDIGEISVSTHCVRYMDGEGNTAAEHPFNYRLTSYGMLYRGLLGCFDDDRYHLGEEIVGFEQDNNGGDVRLASDRSVRCDLLVCADGIHSTGRQLLLPNVTPEYMGWRGTVGEAELTTQTFDALKEAITYHVMPNGHALIYPIPGADGSLEPRERLSNWLWYRNVPQGPELDDLVNDTEGHVEELYDTARSVLPPPFAEVLLKTDTPFLQVVYDVEVPQMAFGRVCLIRGCCVRLAPPRSRRNRQSRRGCLAARRSGPERRG